MMDKDSILQGFGSRMGAGKHEIFDGKVVSVDLSKMTIDIQLGDGDEDVILSDVKMRSVVDDGKIGMVCIPKKDSYVVFAKIEGAQDYVLIKTSELEKIHVEIESATMVVTKDGFELKKGSVSLLKLFEDLKSILENFKVNTPSGPSVGVLPDTVASLSLFETNFKQLLK